MKVLQRIISSLKACIPVIQLSEKSHFCDQRAPKLVAQLQKVFLPPGTGFLRRNFPNIDKEFSYYGGGFF